MALASLSPSSSGDLCGPDPVLAGTPVKATDGSRTDRAGGKTRSARRSAAAGWHDAASRLPWERPLTPLQDDDEWDDDDEDDDDDEPREPPGGDWDEDDDEDDDE